VGSNLAKDDGFLRAIKVHSGRGEGKQSHRSHIVRFYDMLKIPTDMKRDTCKQNSLPFLTKFSCFAARCCCWLLPELWWLNQE
jgi:hypothetical protein